MVELELSPHPTPFVLLIEVTRHGSHQETEALNATSWEMGTTDLNPEMAESWRREGDGRKDLETCR